ncbi:hypothetical protein GGX14DRAFT_562578 [Mycena pura]|uniref:CxC1-like cysteine cluster associated with KDZ transposases domain-containing protein n=1 Tax=Mycena pura TaxID=153505 RepID=A0AAD6VLJ0_9AGAR|nr:hypothetical protein GGX14DRAFT_562578 [Mycena pura]
MRLTDQELHTPVRSKDAGRIFPVKRPTHLAEKEKPSRPRALIYCANGQTLSQRLVRPLPTRPPQDAFTQDDTDGTVPNDEDGYPHHTSEFIPSERSAAPVSSPSKARATNQWQRWTYDVIPTLVPILMNLLYKTMSLRNTDGLKLETRSACTCRKQRHLDVAVIRMTGLFPCSPLHPSLAVDIQVLDFVMGLFVNMPPNNRAFCSTLETFLRARGFQLATQDTLRVRFGNALEWYTSLRQALGEEIDKLLDAARDLAREEDSGTPRVSARNSSPLPPSSPSPLHPARASSPLPPSSPPVATLSSPSAPSGQKRQRVPDSDESDDDDEPANPNPFAEPPPLRWPTEYLIRRCPACFGGLEHDPSKEVDIQVCADACFTQKRRRKKGGRDPPRMHPRTLFVPETVADDMSAYVEGVRPPKAKPVKKQARTDEPNDGYDEGLQVPRSVLNDCESSFKAADETRQKASTKFFDDTGLMGLLCRHDRVLFLVNMTTPGEKQYYVLLLLETLFQHLPANIRVGVLYDIVCLLHRSCVKYGFLGRYLDRILFGVSVFHAFGHRWPCQLIYHPLKCCGFGFTNGEGCERFWHSISKLISYLRVSGYHRRLFTIDAQVEHADKASLGRLAAWLHRRTIHCEEKLREALADLKESGISESVLRDEWKKQVETQTQPLQRQAKGRGMAAVNEVLQARQNTEQAFARVTSLEKVAADLDSTAEERLYAEINLEQARPAWIKAREKAKRLAVQLGLTDPTALRQLEHASYYTKRANTNLVKKSLLTKLRERKFENDLIERSFRRTRSENQRNEHVGEAIKRREPNIGRLVKAYNKLCADISALIRTKKAPRGVVAPLPIPEKGLYQLDVDDVIWQDVGLDDNVPGSSPPLWLADANVRSRIRAMLQKDRCGEEAPRLLWERGHLQIWFAMEWKVVCELITMSQGALQYMFQLRRQELLELYVVWKKSLDPIAFDDMDLPEWGPTQQEVLACQISGVTASWDIDDNADMAESDEMEEDYDDDNDDDDLFQILGAVERGDRNVAGVDEEDIFVE